MRTLLRVCTLALGVLLLAPAPADGQRPVRMAIGGGLGVAAGVGVTLSAITFRARFMDEYLHSPDDLVNWQTVPLIGGPAAGLVFGFVGEEELRGSVVGSLAGLTLGAGVGAGLGWIFSREPESPWAGAVMGGGAGMAVGGILGGVLAWRGGIGGRGDPGRPVEVVLVRIPL